METVETHPGADALGFGPLGEQDRVRILAWMEEVYALFTGHVAAERELDVARVHEIAQGRIWSGRDALEIGLIDRLGGLPEAFALAKEKAGLDPEKKYPLAIFPRQRTLWETIFEGGFTGVSESFTLVRALIANGGLRIGGSTSAPIDALSGGEALDEWMRRLAAPQVLARAPEIRIR
jgi:ClpP class serine protease